MIKTIEKHLGPKCDTFEEDCATCEIWSAYEETIREIVKMADELESECNRSGDKGNEQWRAFKGFRNTIRDRFLPERQPDRTLNKDPRDRTFIITDLCMWEKNRQEGTKHDHSIIVIDKETGQSFHINGGSEIRFVAGEISGPATQENYNAMEHEDNLPDRPLNEERE